jgi:hypothetical protein
VRYLPYDELLGSDTARANVSASAELLQLRYTRKPTPPAGSAVPLKLWVFAQAGTLPFNVARSGCAAGVETTATALVSSMSKSAAVIIFTNLI